MCTVCWAERNLQENNFLRISRIVRVRNSEIIKNYIKLLLLTLANVLWWPWTIYTNMNIVRFSSNFCTLYFVVSYLLLSCVKHTVKDVGTFTNTSTGHTTIKQLHFSVFARYVVTVDVIVSISKLCTFNFVSFWKIPKILNSHEINDHFHRIQQYILN